VSVGIVEVVWTDSVILNQGEWTDLHEIKDALKPKNHRHRTVGYLVGENKHSICLGSSINDQPDFHGTRVAGGMVIPKSAIIKTIVHQARES
jgi:hypothetical protein